MAFAWYRQFDPTLGALRWILEWRPERRQRPPAAGGTLLTRLTALCEVAPDPESFLAFVNRHLPGLGGGTGARPVYDRDLWEAIGAPLPPRTYQIRSEPFWVRWGHVLFALAYVVPWVAFWLSLRTSVRYSEVKPLVLSDAQDKWLHVSGLRLWDGKSWRWLGACSHALGRGSLLARESLLCGREDCEYGDAELYWRRLFPQSIDGLFPGRVEFYEPAWVMPALWRRAPEDRLRYGFIKAIGYLGDRLELSNLRVEPSLGAPGLTLVPTRADVAAWVYKQLVDLIRLDMGEPGAPVCPGCGKSFAPSRRDQKACSPACRVKLHRLRRGQH
jgi:hypothetical protein